MNKDFVPYQPSLDLKDLEFDEPCFGYYNGQGNYIGEEGKMNSNCNKLGMHGAYCTAPTFSQSFRFFREQYGLQHRPWSGKINKVFYGYDILNIDEQEFVINNTEDGGGDCDYVTYEEAELECLIKLIEIVKNNTL